MSSTGLGGRRFLLSGASGLLGSAIRDSLVRSGGEVAQLVRREPMGLREIRWDPAGSNVASAPTAALEGFAAAIHLSGANVSARRWTPEYRRELWVSRVGSTQALSRMLTQLRRRPGVLLVASATGIYGDRGDEILDEDSGPGSGFLADLCREWEDAAREACEAGIRVVHLRFGVVLATGGGALAKMLPVFRLGLGGRLGSGRQWMSWIGLPDAVAAVRYLMETGDLAGPVNVCAPSPVTNERFTATLAKRLHRRAFLPAPAFALRMAFGEMANEALLASARVKPKRLIDAGFPFMEPAIDQALDAVAT